MKKQKRPFDVVTVRRRGTKARGGLFGDVAGFTEAMAAEQPRNVDGSASAADPAPVKADDFFKPKFEGGVPKARVLDDKTQAPLATAAEPARKRGRARKERSEEDEALQAAKAKHRLRERRAEARREREVETMANEIEDGDASASRPEAPDVMSESGSAEGDGASVDHDKVGVRRRERAAYPLARRWERHLPRWGKRRR